MLWSSPLPMSGYDAVTPGPLSSHQVSKVASSVLLVQAESPFTLVTGLTRTLCFFPF